MTEGFEDNNRYENLGKQIDDLDKNINDLDNKSQERLDFTTHMQELKNIYNSFKMLDADIDSLSDENEKKDLQERLDKLKVTMMDLISDGSIDNFIDGKTNDEFINNEVNNLNKLFRDKIESLIQSLEPGSEKLNNVLSGDLRDVTETLGFLGIPYGEIPILLQPGKINYCLGFPLNGEIYVVVGGQLRACEPVFNAEDFKLIHPEKTKPLPEGFSLKYSEKPASGFDTSTGKQETRQLSKDLGHGFNISSSVESKGHYGTLWTSISKKWSDIKLGDDVKTNTQIIASYSPGSIGNSMVAKEEDGYEHRYKVDEGGWREKATYKGKLQQNFKFKNGFSINITEIFKTSDFSKKTNELITEMRFSYKPKSNINFSVNANLGSKGKSSVLGGFKWSF